MKNLKIKFSVSRGRETYGWNIISLWDKGTKYSTCGGGYDMTGSVFGQWLTANYLEEIISKLKPHEEGGLYGFHRYKDKYRLDGACGLDSMITIAKAIGLGVQCCYHKNCIDSIIVWKEIEDKDNE